MARTIQGEPGANLIGGGRSSADWAAFANGVHIRYFDCNDTYLSLEPAHPSDNWAAVAAAGERAGPTGRIGSPPPPSLMKSNAGSATPRVFERADGTT